MYYDVLIKQYNSTIQISYIFPQYHLVTSILPDYIYELAGFDAERIAEYMTKEILGFDPSDMAGMMAGGKLPGMN